MIIYDNLLLPYKLLLFIALYQSSIFETSCKASVHLCMLERPNMSDIISKRISRLINNKN